MRRRILSRPTWRPRRGRAQRLRMPFARYASIRTVSESTLFGGSVHRMRSVLIRATNNALQSFYRSLFLAEGRPSSQLAQSPHARGPKRWGTKPRRIRRFTIYTPWQATSSPSLASLCFGFLLPLSRLAPRAVDGAQWLVDLCAHPQTVQKHRELSGHGPPPPVSLRSCLRGRLSSHRD